MSIAIELDEVSKRYRRSWVLRRVSIRLEAGRRYAITGPNGSGKSTLMRILSGHLSPTRGQRRYRMNGGPLPAGEVFRHLTFAAPYIELIEEFTLRELIRFQLTFKPWLPPLDTAGAYRLLGLDHARDQEIRYFSSGMKQRLKLLLALAADVPLVLLDEPTTNLDRQGVAWYHDLIGQLVLPHHRLLLVASNVEEDFSFCEERIDVRRFKRQAPEAGKRRQP